MIQELSGPNKVVGAKQARRALRAGRAAPLWTPIPVCSSPWSRRR